MRETLDRPSNTSRTWTRPARVFALVALVAGATFVGQSGAAGTPPPGSTYFISTCAFSHRAFDDPIVFPREPGFSHNHTFVGNISTNAFSTLATLRGARTTCNPIGDTAAYWAPTLYVAGVPVIPLRATIYYRRDTIAPVRPFPPGLRMVAGNSHALFTQSLQITYWDCNVIKTDFYGPRAVATRAATTPEITAGSSGIPGCQANTTLQLHVNFPDCWNGTSLDSSDHKSHMAYSVGGRCPQSHPVAVPALSIVYDYPGRAATSSAMLSSGGQLSGHADFINTWHQANLTTLVADCLNHQHGCGSAAAAAPDVN